MSLIPDIRLHWWDFPPYVIATSPNDPAISLQNLSGAFPAVLRQVFFACGVTSDPEQQRRAAPPGSAPSLSVERLNNPEEFEKMTATPDGLDLLLPFSTDTDELIGTNQFLMPSEFVPLLSSPGAVHFYKALEQPVGSDLVTVILQGWPMLVFILLGAGYSGIIIWLLDRLWNPSNFPKPFIRGFWEGFWWAFVTMTTVGYGDTTPRSFQARMFGLIWIVVGITILSVFTATVTTVLTQESLGVHYTIPGNEVGVVNGTEDYKLVIKQGGKPAVAANFDELIRVARTGKTHSVVYDQYGFVYEQHKLGDDFIVETIIRNPVVHGVMIVGPQSKTKTCLITALKQSRRQTFRSMATLISPLSRKTIKDPDSSQNLFQPKTILYIWYGLAFWVFLFVCFILWEFLYWRPKHKRRKEMKRHINLERGMQPPDAISTTSDSDNISCFPKRPRYCYNHQQLRQHRSPLGSKMSNRKSSYRHYIRPQIKPLPVVRASPPLFNNRKKELIEVGNLDALIRRQKEELDDLEEELDKFKADWELRVKDMKRQHREERRKLLRLMDHEDSIRNETGSEAISGVKTEAETKRNKCSNRENNVASSPGDISGILTKKGSVL